MKLHIKIYFRNLVSQKLVINGDSVGVAELDNAMIIASEIDFGGGAEWK